MRMLSSRKSVAQCMILLTVFCLLFFRHTSLSHDYPFYFCWDIDLTTTVDTILINSGLVPDHICHPGFGMNLLLQYSERVAHFFNIVSAINLNDLSDSLNPLACVAELTSFLRNHSPFICLGIVLFLWGALCVLLRISLPVGIFALSIIGFQQSFVYNSIMIRTEIYSVFFWSCAIFIVALAVRAKRPGCRLALLFATGLLLGLSFLTKIQSLFYVCAAFLLFLLGIFQEDAESRREMISLPLKQRFMVVGLCFFNLAAFLSMLIPAYFEQIPSGFATFASGYSITMQAILLICLLLGLLSFQLDTVYQRQTFLIPFTVSAYLTMILSGFFFSFGLHFLTFLDPSQSWTYLLYDFKMLFLRKSFLIEVHSFTDYLMQAYKWFGVLTLPILVHAGLLVLLGASWWRSKRGNRLGLFILAGLSTFVLLSLTVGSRFVMNDLLWAELLLSFLSLVYCAIILKEYSPNLFQKALCWSALCILLLYNVTYNHEIQQRIDHLVAFFGWKPQYWLSGVYSGNHLKYKRLMEEKHLQGRNISYSDIFTREGSLAMRHEEARRIASFVFPNQPVDLRNIGLVMEGLAVWKKNQAYRISRVPQFFQGALLVDTDAVIDRDEGYFDVERIEKRKNYLNKFPNPKPSLAVSILPRSDLKVFLFVRRDDFQSLALRKVGRPDDSFWIELMDGNKKLMLYGLELTEYSVIPTNWIKGEHLFVIRPLYGL